MYWIKGVIGILVILFALLNTEWARYVVIGLGAILVILSLWHHCCCGPKCTCNEEKPAKKGKK